MRRSLDTLEQLSGQRPVGIRTGSFSEGGTFLLTMHPQIIGHRSRIDMLEHLLKHIQSRSGVWFATHEEVARIARSMID